MQSTGSGGLGAVSFGINEGLLLLVVAAVVIVVLWKVAKLLWAAFSG